MRRLALVALLLALPFALARPGAAEEARVTILHTTDVHGSLLPWDDLTDKAAPRGLARAATLIAKVRAEGHPVLLLDAGDAIAGSPLTSVWHHAPAGPEPVTMVMNAMHYDAMTVGNHEFDFGPAALESTAHAARFPFLGANIARTDGGTAFAASYEVGYANGVRIGVIGLTTPAIPQLTDSASFAGYTFQDPIETAKRLVPMLRNDHHCDVVIALAHTGLEQDPRTGELRKGDAPGEDFGWRLANEVPGLDLVILGHTHVVVPFARVGGTLVTQAGKFAENLGRVDLTLTRSGAGAAWTIASKRAYVLALGDTTADDPAITSSLVPYAARTRLALDEVVAQASAPLAAPAGRFADNALWQLVQRAQLDASGADVSLAALFDPAQAIPAGPVRVRDLMRLYPYDNSLAVVELTGAQLKAALEQSARFLATYTFEDGRPLAEPGMPGFNFDMAYGVTYVVNPTQPAGQRIARLARDGKPLADDASLRVVVNGYRAAGGGGFAMIRDAKRTGGGAPSAPEAVLAYVRKAKTLDGTVAPSWSLLPDWIGAPERPLVDRLVRHDVLTRPEALRLHPNEPATREAFGRWLSAALGAPASRAAAGGGTLTMEAAFVAVERAARTAKLPVGAAGDAAFRRGLVTGTSLAIAAGHLRAESAAAQPLTNAQALGLVANVRFPQLRVLETTDFHGALLGGTKERRTGRAIGSSVALAAAIEHYRAENPEGTVLLDGGDMFQGTMISNLQFGRPVVSQMNHLGYAAAAIGNHDFDWGVDTLRARIAGMQFSAMGANIVERATARRPRWVRADTSFVRRGVRIAILGLAYPGTPRVTLPSNVAAYRFDDDSACAVANVPRLRKSGAGVVIVLGHTPAETDSTRRAYGDILRLASGVRGVDAFFGGHSHNVVEDDVNGASVLVGGSNGQNLAIADLTVDALKNKVVEHRQHVVTVYADEYPADSVWVARVGLWNANVAPVAAEVIGRNALALGRSGPEATIGDFITDAMRFSSGADIAMQNPGGMRANLAEGEITRGAIYAIMPFDNTIVMLSLTGADVRRALEQGLRSHRVTQVSGIRYAIDWDQPVGSRVAKLTLPDGSALDDAKTYKVAVNNFMATGGDNYDALNRGGGVAGKDESGLIIRGAIEAYVRDRCKGGAELKIVEDGRITQTGAERSGGGR